MSLSKNFLQDIRITRFSLLPAAFAICLCIVSLSSFPIPGICQEQLNNASELWSMEISGCNRMSVNVHGDRIYVKRDFNRMSSDRYADLQCYNLDGVKLWDYTGQINNYFVDEQDNVYLGFYNLIALDPAGKVLWETEVIKPNIIMVPWATSKAGYLYVRGGDPGPLIFDLRGNLLWETKEDGLYRNVLRSAVAEDGTLYMFRGGYLQAINPRKGEIWRIPIKYAEPQILTDGNLLTETEGVASCFSAQGKLLWDYDLRKHPLTSEASKVSQYIIDNHMTIIDPTDAKPYHSTVCTASGTGVIYYSRPCQDIFCLDEGGQYLWQRQVSPEGTDRFGHLKVGPSGNVFFTEGSKVFCLDLLGNELWHYDTSDTTDLWRITSDGYVLLWDSHSRSVKEDIDVFTMLDPKGEHFWTLKVGDRIQLPQPCSGGSVLMVTAFDAEGEPISPSRKPAKLIMKMLR